MKYADQKDQIVESLLAKAKELPTGSSISTARLLGMLCPYRNRQYDGLEIDSPGLFDLNEKLFIRAAEVGLYFDASKHWMLIEGLPYNLDFTIRPLKPRVVLDAIRYSETTWFVSRQELVIEMNNRTIHLSEHDFERHAANAVHQCIDQEWSELGDFMELCDFAQWDDEYEQPVLDGTTWTLQLMQGTEVVKNVHGSNGYPAAWRIFCALQEKCRTLCNMAKLHFDTEH